MTDANETGRFLSLLPDGLRTYIIPIVKDRKIPDVKGNIKARIEEVRLPKHRTIERVKQGGNVAAYAMKDGLVFIDIDTENGNIKLPREKVDELIEKLDTFTVMTRNGGFQLYGINRGFENSLIYYNDINIGEIRADWQYVLLPGSYVPPDENATESATGLYEIVREQEIKPVSPQDLPEWLEVRRKEIKEEKLIKPAQPSQTWINEVGMSLDEIRKKDQKLDELLQGPYECGYPSRSEADMACATKLWFWRFDESQIAGILQDYRAYEKTQRGDYLSRTVSKAIGGERYVGKAKKNKPTLAAKNKKIPENSDNSTRILRYIVRDFDVFNDVIEKNNYKPMPIIDNIGGFESEEEEWVVDMIKKGIIELRPDSYNPLNNGKKCAVGINNFDDLDRLITKVEKKEGDPVIFYIYFGDSKISFTGAELNSLSKWRSKLIEKNIVINHTKETSWKFFDVFLLNLLEQAEVIWVDEESEEEILGNIVLSEIDKLVVVQTREEFLRNPVSCLHENGYKTVKSSTILDIIRRKDLRVSLREIREVLRPHLAKSSSQIRLKDKRISVWFFKEVEDDENF